MANEQDIKELREDVAQIKKTLYIGNGTPPIVARMTKAETDISSTKETMRELKQGQTWLLRFVIANLVTALGSIAGSFVPKILALLSAH